MPKETTKVTIPDVEVMELGRKSAVMTAPVANLVIVPSIRLSINRTPPPGLVTVNVPLANAQTPLPATLQPGPKSEVVIAILAKLPTTLTLKLGRVRPPDVVLVAVPLMNVPVSKLTLLANAAVGKAKARSVSSIPRLVLTLIRPPGMTVSGDLTKTETTLRTLFAFRSAVLSLLLQIEQTFARR